jgi:uncharacterized protein YwgA
MDSQQQAWIASSVEALQKSGSWTGRIHIHKHLFVLKVLGIAEVPFEFELYQYGPYSFDLDDSIGEMETYGQLEKYYPKPGYGPRYRLTGNNEPTEQRLPREDLERVRACASRLSQFNSNQLELIATCIWAQRVEGISEEKDIINRVRMLKPKYGEFDVQRALVEAKAVSVYLEMCGR